MDNQEFISDLKNIFGDVHVATDEQTRKEFSTDKCPGNLLTDNVIICLAVVRPTRDKYREQLVEFVKLTARCGKKIIVRGGGSGVCGAITPRDGENTVILDMTVLDKIYEINLENKYINVGAGIKGDILEEIISKYHKHTIGHSPASLAISTPGGWVATRSSGQFSSHYGTIENLVTEIEVITADGQIRWVQGDELRSFSRMEGTTGIITRVKMKIFPILKYRKFLTFSFKNLKNATEFISFLRRHFEQKKIYIKALRLYDWLDYYFIARPYKTVEDKEETQEQIKKEKSILAYPSILNFLLTLLDKIGILRYTMILILESDFEAALNEESDCVTLLFLKRCGGKIENKKIAEAWYENRFKLDYEKLEQRFRKGIIVDAFDCRPACADGSGDFSSLISIYKNVKNALFGLAICGAHFGLDRDGFYVYFTLATKNNRYGGVEFYNRIWKNILLACINSGGFTTHHHGIGRLKAGEKNSLVGRSYGKDWYEEIAIPAKRQYDPENLFNPKNLF